MSENNFYKKEFKKATKEQRAEFLKQLFEKNLEVQKQFKNFIQERERHEKFAKEIKGTDVAIDKMQEEFRTSLQEVNIDYDVYKYFDLDGRSYVPEYEQADEAAEEMLRKEYFEEQGKKARILLTQGNILNAVKVMLSIYEGSINVYDLLNDELHVYEDNYNDTLKMLAEEQIEKTVPLIKKAILSDEVIEYVLDLFFSRVKFWKDKYDPKLNTDNWAEYNVVYDIKKWEAFILMFLENKKAAVFLEQKLLTNDLKNIDTSNLFLKISELKGSDSDWVKTAETFAKEDKKIMAQLLDFYFEKKQEKDFYRTAKKAFQYFPRELGEKILELIQPKIDQDFYIKVLRSNVAYREKIELYLELRKYMSIEEINLFIQAQKKNVNFFVEMLAVEKNYEEILKIARQHAATDSIGSYKYGDFEKVILPVLEIYPSECFELIRRKVYKVLEEGRGNHIYEKVVVWLILMKKIKGFENKFKTFLPVFAKSHYRLRNLKSEMQRKGLL